MAAGMALAAGAVRASESRRTDLDLTRWRAIDDESPIALDVDLDGRLDRLTPRQLKLRRAFIPGAAPFPEGDVERYVAFSLDTASRRSISTVVQFRFGTENGGYARYLLRAAGDLDGDGRGDLEFRVGGGDLPGEVLVLLDRGDRFEAHSSGVLRCECEIEDDLRLVDSGDRERELARWDRTARRFAGDGVVWVIGALAAVRDGAAADARVVASVPGGTALRRWSDPDGAPAPPGWLRVVLDGRAGWISERVVEAASPAAETR